MNDHSIDIAIGAFFVATTAIGLFICWVLGL